MKELVKCVECGENKEREDFRTNNARENGLSRKCIDCLSVKITSYIYIIKNPAWEEYVKVGRAKNVFSRLDCYNTSSPKRDYELIYYKSVKHISSVERHIHKKFGENKWEWYKVSSEEMIREIEHFLNTRKLID